MPAVDEMLALEAVEDSSILTACVSLACVLLIVFVAARGAVGATASDFGFHETFGCYRIAGDAEDANANVDAAGGRIDVDAALRKAHGYAAPVVLPGGGAVVSRERRRLDAAVVCLPGLGRCADDFDLVEAWEARGLEPVFVDFRRYGRAFRLGTDARYNYTADLREYGRDVGEALAHGAALGYASFVLCGLSTGGLALMDFATGLGDAGLRELGVRALVFCSPACRMNAVSVPRPVDDVVLALCRCLRAALPRAYDALGANVVLARDAALGDDPHSADGASWIDKVMAERGRTYDRYLNPTRGKPTWLGYVVAMLEAQRRLKARAAGAAFAKLRTPALCFTPRWDASSKDRPPGPVEPGTTTDEHIDVDEVEQVFASLFDAATSTFARLDCQHEVLASDWPVVAAVLDATKAAFDAT